MNTPNSSAPSSPEAWFSVITEHAQALGFSFCTFGLRLPLPITQPRTVYYSNYPAAWQARYNEARYIDVDPTVRHGMRSSAPIVWSDAVFAEVPQLWQEAQSHGIRHGWAQSRRDPEGIFSLLVLARPDPPIAAQELSANEQRMQWLVHWAHTSMKSACDDRSMRPQPVGLSPRETEVLRWTAEGKTASEIATILDVSERTVNFHVNSAVTKLDANNKTNAAVRASLLGLIW